MSSPAQLCGMDLSADVGLALSQDLTTLVPVLGDGEVKFDVEYLNQFRPQ